MKMYEPELNLGDSVWVMQNNKPTELEIVEIEVICRPGFENGRQIRIQVGGKVDWFVKYTLTGGHTLHESTPNSPGDFIFRTKKELIDSL